jgi:ABC-2 type transport system permease protein
MFGCAYYPWSMLRPFKVLQYAVLINPLVYASEGLRGSLPPRESFCSAACAVCLHGAELTMRAPSA